MSDFQCLQGLGVRVGARATCVPSVLIDGLIDYNRNVREGSHLDQSVHEGGGGWVGGGGNPLSNLIDDQLSLRGDMRCTVGRRERGGGERDTKNTEDSGAVLNLGAAQQASPPGRGWEGGEGRRTRGEGAHLGKEAAQHPYCRTACDPGPWCTQRGVQYILQPDPGTYIAGLQAADAKSKLVR